MLASPRLAPLLALCFTAFMVHGYLPDSMMSVLLVPVIKDKAGNVSSSDNCRPIALAGVLSKVVEHILLERVSSLISSADNQFGFKPKHGTDVYLYFKGTIDWLQKEKLLSIYVLLRCFQGI